MPQLALFLLGPPYIEREGELINVDTRKAIALLAYLAVTRQRHSRDSLANLLWPDYDQVNARATLRRTLSALNKALAGDWLDVDRETIGLTQGAHLRLDVDEFNKCLAECRTHGHAAAETCPRCLKPLSQAVTVYRGDFMAGFSLRDSPNFDDWQFFQADSLRRELSHALERLVQGYTTQGNFEAAISYARRWLSLDRLHEPAHRQLMQLYAWAGQRAAALHQYRECVQALEQELGVTPLESTTQLYQSIKENRIAPPPVQVDVPVVPQEGATSAAPGDRASSPATVPVAAAQFPVQHNDYPLLGRAAEWDTLLQAYGASATSGHIILLEGEAGIGKTRLAEEMVAHVHAQGAAVIAAHCYEGETQLAYGPFVAGMRAAIAGQPDASWLKDVPSLWVSEAARLLPELTTLRPEVAVAPPLDHPGAQGRFFEGLRHVLLALLKGDGTRPGIVFFDDMQWADEASLDLLAYLVRRLREYPLCLLITWRAHSVPRDHSLHRLLADAQRSGNATVLSLTRLDRQTVRLLAQSVVAASPKATTDIVQRLYEETEGLPFFLIEYLTAIAKGVLAPENERWSLPGGVRDLLHSRLDAVDEIGWQLLTTAAAIGRSFDFDTLREASGRGEEETVTALEALIAFGLVAEEPGSSNAAALTYDFSHEKLRTLVYEETSLARRRLLHRRIAEVLVGHERGNREPGLRFQPGQVAHHYRLAGNETAAAEYYKRAGERARILYANTEALAHFHLALALGHPDRAGLHEAIGDLYTLTGEYAAALKSYETAAALGSVENLSTIEQKLGNVYGRRGEWELAESHLEAALFALGEAGSTGERAKIYADWSLAAYRHGQAAKALELAQLALELAEAGSDRQALAQVHNLLGILASSQQQTESAHHHLEQSLALAESLNDAGIQAAALNNLALAYAAHGETERAIALARNALALCVSQGDRHREAALHSNLADMLHAAGRAEEAMPHLKQAVSIYAEIGVEAGTVQPEIWKLVEW